MFCQSPSFGGKTKRAAASGAALEAMTHGDLITSEGAQIMGLIDSFRRTLEIAELEARLVALEARVLT